MNYLSIFSSKIMKKSDSKFLDILGKNGATLFERINLFHINCFEMTLKHRNLKALASLTNILSQYPKENISIFSLGKRVISFLEAHFDEFSYTSIELNITMLSTFKNCILIMSRNKPQLINDCENDIKNHKKSCSNLLRILHLKISNIIEYRSSFHINAYIDTMTLSIDALKDVPMTPETEIGDFSKEDGENVSIPSVFEPLLHEIWPRFVNNLNANVTRVLRYDDFG